MKKMLLCLPLMALMLLNSCAEKYKDTTLYQRNGRPKPIVAVLPVVDSRKGHIETDRGIAWDISKELTAGIRKRVSESQKLYLLKDQGNLAIAKQLISNEGRELSHQFTNSNPAEFIVATELLNEQENPFDINRFDSKHPPKGQIAEVLNIDFRIKVFDMRESKPKVILQEIVHNHHFISKTEAQVDYSTLQFNDASFSRTPVGMAHNKLIREVAGRVENYIRASKG